ncbi:hypothetical protein [Myxococcus stipitatus]|uniref:hypothetical protein n=1 Tax=Myxococcus stipitatus TaxID=83455 RepID=UPI0030D3ED54
MRSPEYASRSTALIPFVDFAPGDNPIPGGLSLDVPVGAIALVKLYASLLSRPTANAPLATSVGECRAEGLSFGASLSSGRDAPKRPLPLNGAEERSQAAMGTGSPCAVVKVHGGQRLFWDAWRTKAVSGMESHGIALHLKAVIVDEDTALAELVRLMVQAF